MRALVLASELPPGPGGIGNHAHHLARQLVERGWTVAVVAPQDYASDAEITDWSSRQPYAIERLWHWPTSPLQGAVWAWRTLRAIRRHRPDVVIASGLRIVWMVAAVTRWSGRPFVAIGHGIEFGVGGWARRLARWAFGRADVVVCVSEYTRDRLRRAGVTARRVDVIPNGADGDIFRPPDRPEPRQPSAPRLLVTVGTVSRRKGHDLVVRALPRLVAAGHDVRYVAIGLAPEVDRYRELADELGVGDRVEWRGARPTDEIVELLGAADLFVLPSRHTPEGDFEGFGIAVVEAALCGVPAIVARSSGLVEAISDGETGLAVAPDDPEALADAILSLLRDEPRRAAMGGRALERARAEQTWRRRGDAYAALLREVVGARSGG